MAFPTIPTVAAGRVLTLNQLNSTATRTFPALSGLTKNAGDLLIAIIVTYQSTTNPQFSSWSDGFIEFHDSGSSTTLGVGMAYKWSTGSETEAITVTQAGTITGDASMILLSIAGAHPSTPPEAGSRADGTSAEADPASFNPAGWDAEDTLWISVVGNGMTGATGSWVGTSTVAPTNYTDRVNTNAADTSVIGDVEAAVAFRQLNAAAEDVGIGSADVSNARNTALVVAVRPAPGVSLGAATGAVDWVGSATGTTVRSAVATGSIAWAGAATGAAGFQGSATGSITWAGTADGEAPAPPPNEGAATGSITWAGTADGTTTRQGASTGTISWAGSATGITTRAGAGTGSVAWAGTADGSTVYAGSATGAVSWAGTATGATTRTGDATGSITWSGSANGEAPTEGVQEGSADGSITWAGSATGTADHNGAATGSIVWNGSATGAIDHAGVATGAITWTGSATGIQPSDTFWTPNPVAYTRNGVVYTPNTSGYVPF